MPLPVGCFGNILFCIYLFYYFLGFIFCFFSGLLSLCFGFVAESQCASCIKPQKRTIQTKQWESIVFTHNNLFRNLAFIQWIE